MTNLYANVSKQEMYEAKLYADSSKSCTNDMKLSTKSLLTDLNIGSIDIPRDFLVHCAKKIDIFCIYLFYSKINYIFFVQPNSYLLLIIYQLGVFLGILSLFLTIRDI